MPLTPGDRFGAYEIISTLGVGGMGEVYRAADSRLKRHVAIKVLPEAFSSDPERLARFQREAETLAALNHPNIAAIYGIEDADGVSGLVMALVDGPTLADVIAEGPLAVDDALSIARQIAAAIEAAHEQGIVHRDLKPANIKVVDRDVKVLDFGLAKNIPLAAQSSAHSPTITSPAMTMMGVVLGTAAYMSPEQARGRAVDKRADIWAFGVVLYEMLTGRRPFDGEDVSLTLAAVMTAEPDFSLLPRSVSPSVRACLVQCLQKDVRLRLRDIGDARLFLDGVFAVADRVDAPRTTGRPRVMRIALALTALAAVALLGTGAGWALRPLPSLPVTRFDYQVPDNLGPGNRPNIAVSRDGQRLSYGTVRGLFVHFLDGGKDRLVAAFDNSVPTVHPSSPTFSPDGASVSFFIAGQLKRVAVDGGTAASVCAATDAIGSDWALDGYIYFASREGISRVAAGGGTAEVIARSLEGEQLTTPQLLPDGQTLLFTAYEIGKASESFITNGGTTLQPSKVIAQTFPNGERHVIVSNGGNARYVASGHILYTVGTALFGQRFNPKALRVDGAPVSLLDGIQIGTSGAGVGVAHYSVSDAGSLFYLPRTDTSVPAVWVDRSGKPEAIPTLPPTLFRSPRLSSDGRKLLATAQNDVRIFDLETGRESPVTIDRTAGEYAAWSPDETRVVYSSTRAGTAGPMNLWMQALDGSAARQVSALDGLVHVDAWSPDGKWILAHRHPPRVTGFSLMRFPVDGDRVGEPQDFTSPPGTQEAASFSPDGAFVAYVDTVSGRPEVVIRPFQQPGRVVPVSVGGGREPYWTKSGELFYRRYSDDAMMVVKVSTAPTLRVGPSQQLFAGTGPQGGSSRSSYAVTPDGQRFIMSANRVIGETNKPPSISVVLNWINELKARIP